MSKYNIHTVKVCIPAIVTRQIEKSFNYYINIVPGI